LWCNIFCHARLNTGASEFIFLALFRSLVLLSVLIQKNYCNLNEKLERKCTLFFFRIWWRPWMRKNLSQNSGLGIFFNAVLPLVTKSLLGRNFYVFTWQDNNPYLTDICTYWAENIFCVKNIIPFLTEIIKLADNINYALFWWTLFYEKKVKIMYCLIKYFVKIVSEMIRRFYNISKRRIGKSVEGREIDGLRFTGLDIFIDLFLFSILA